MRCSSCDLAHSACIAACAGGACAPSSRMQGNPLTPSVNPDPLCAGVFPLHWHSRPAGHSSGRSGPTPGAPRAWQCWTAHFKPRLCSPGCPACWRRRAHAGPPQLAGACDLLTQAGASPQSAPTSLRSLHRPPPRSRCPPRFSSSWPLTASCFGTCPWACSGRWVGELWCSRAGQAAASCPVRILAMMAWCDLNPMLPVRAVPQAWELGSCCACLSLLY